MGEFTVQRLIPLMVAHLVYTAGVTVIIWKDRLGVPGRGQLGFIFLSDPTCTYLSCFCTSNPAPRFLGAGFSLDWELVFLYKEAAYLTRVELFEKEVRAVSEIDTEVIYCGDNLKVLSNFPDNSVDLIYADPPFFSNRNYEIIWGNGAELKVYEDRWKGGIHVYIEWMKERLWQCRRVLKDTGSIYLHCDHHACHRLRVAMDEVFGEKNFQNEIIWHYRSGGGTARRFRRKHDNIFFYTKRPKDYTFNADEIREPYAPSTISRLAYRGAREKNVQKVLERGGRIPDDVWLIGHIQGNSREAMGYPTQKPEALLKRIVQASSNPGGVVLDPFCGCGTTLVVAHQLLRRWIGVDVSPIACDLMRRRLMRLGAANIRIIGAPKTIPELKKMEPFEFQYWVIDRIGGTHTPKRAADQGIDGYTFLEHYPVQIKQQERVGRNVADNFETACRRAKQQKGYIVAFSFTRNAYEETARAKQEGLEIILVRVDELDQHF